MQSPPKGGKIVTESVGEVEKVKYDAQVIRSERRTVAVEITRDRRVIVRAPLRMKDRDIEAFLELKSPWIESHLARPVTTQPPLRSEEKAALMALAREDIPHRVEKFSPQVGVSVGRVTIRCQRTRWGSCSSKGNLNFNCLLMLCPEWVRDYVVIHELCHRREMNHSPRFWARVSSNCPDYAAARKWLQAEGRAIMERV